MWVNVEWMRNEEADTQEEGKRQDLTGAWQKMHKGKKVNRDWKIQRKIYKVQR